ncbi:hypothetical protein ABXN37_22530 [Piscinibacter sakaiensis]|uniref:hypothetical protein n=1 Tax=Piscinibacter sakaiensis TaxID=1547922 RepID=UPI0012F9C4FD|nr:hypothetical protein [Piscinibacter sakaiensis]
MKLRHHVLIAAMSIASHQAMAACFTVYGPRDEVVYQSIEPPVDASKSLSEGTRARFGPGHHLMLSPDAFCHGQDSAGDSQGAGAPGQAGTGGRALALASAYGAMQRRSTTGTTTPWSAGAGGSGRSPGRDVSVSGYTRADGTAVRSYTRSAPGRGR